MDVVLPLGLVFLEGFLQEKDSQKGVLWREELNIVLDEF